MRILFITSYLLAMVSSGFGAPFEFPIKGDPGIVLKLDREYSCQELSATDAAQKKNVRLFMFIPSDEQSSILFSIGPDAKGETEATIAAKYDGAKISKTDGRINGRKVQWLRWRDTKHLYSSCEVILPDHAGTERRVSVWLVANTAERLAALETAFSTIGFY